MTISSVHPAHPIAFRPRADRPRGMIAARAPIAATTATTSSPAGAATGGGGAGPPAVGGAGAGTAPGTEAGATLEARRRVVRFYKCTACGRHHHQEDGLFAGHLTYRDERGLQRATVARHFSTDGGR